MKRLPPRRRTPGLADPPAEALVPVAPPEENPAIVYVVSFTSKDSRRAMRSSLDVLARRLLGPEGKGRDVRWQDLRHAHVAALRTWLAETYAPASANRHLAALKGVLKKCWLIGLVPHDDYARAIEVKPIQGSGPQAGRYLAGAEVAALFAAASGPGAKALRDRAILALAAGSGLRRAEIAGLDLERYADGALTVTGKGGKTRIAWPPANARGHLSAWFAVRGSEAGPLVNPVVNGRVRTRRRLAEASVYRILDDLGAKAGLRRFGPHDFRRTWISNLLDAGTDLALAARLAGHSDPKTTARYDRRPERAAKEAAERITLPDVPAAVVPAVVPAQEHP